MANPFRKPASEDFVGTRVWDHLFSPRRVDVERQAHKAKDVIAWAERPYHQVFLDWLRDEAEKPVPVGDHMTMVVGTTRANTLKEIRAHLVALEEKARSALEEIDG